MTIPPIFRAILQLGRVSNLPSALSNVTVGWVLAFGGFSWHLLPLWLGAGFAYLAGMTMNDAADADLDREHKPERPIPMGLMDHVEAWSLGIGELVLAILLLWVSGASWFWTFLLAACILAYTLYHKAWVGSVWVMGACRLLLYIIGATAAQRTHGVYNNIWLWALILGAYVVGITLSARREAQKLPPRLQEGALLLSPLVAIILVHTWAVTLFALLQAAFVVSIFLLARRNRLDLNGLIGWLLAGLLLVDATAIASYSVLLALVFVALVPLLRWFQRWIAAT